MKCTSNENLSASYLKHKEESDQIIKEIKETFDINKTYHDGLSEAQTIIGRLQLELDQKDGENQMLRNQLLVASSMQDRHFILASTQTAS